MHIVSVYGFTNLIVQAAQKIARREFELLEPEPDIVVPKSMAIATPQQDWSSRFGVNLVGYFTGQFGIATSVRAFGHALKQAGVPIVFNNVISRAHGERQTFTLGPVSDFNPYRINIIHLNEESKDFFVKLCPSYASGKYNVGIWYWELPKYPKQWKDRFGYYDELWVTSSFMEEALSESPIPVSKIRYPLAIPKGMNRSQAKERYSLGDRFVFLFVFDFNSYLERKNPHGLLRAFQKAFDKEDKALLVLNGINAGRHPAEFQLLKEAANGQNVLLLENCLSPEQYYALFSACDCYASLHRAEGLGLPMAEAMSLGKPVIATGYSGNMEFMDNENSLLVEFDLVQLKETHGPYEKGNLWADPDLEHAARLVRWVYENEESAEKIGSKARLDIERKLNPELSAQEIKERLQEIFSRISA